MCIRGKDEGAGERLRRGGIESCSGNGVDDPYG